MRRLRCLLLGDGGPAEQGRSRGQSIVEVALVLPIALLLVGGALDMGRLFFARVSIENAAREGAIFAASNPRCDTDARVGCSDPDTVDWHVRNELTSLADLTVSVACIDDGMPRPSVIDCEPGDAYLVRVEDEFELVTPILVPLLGSSMTLEASATAAVLNPAFDPTATFAPWPDVTPSPAPTSAASAPPGPTPPPSQCTVPNMVGQKVNTAETMWRSAGFTGDFLRTRSGNYDVVNQSQGANGRQPCSVSVTASHS